MVGILSAVVMLSSGLAVVLTTIQKAEAPSCSGGSSCFNFRTNQVDRNQVNRCSGSAYCTTTKPKPQ
jgi:hypothetical protein